MRQVKVWTWKQVQAESNGVQQLSSGNRPVMVSKKVEDHSGTFLGWGIDYEELQGGPAPFTAAIVELHDGTVELVPAPLVQFVS